MKRFVKAIPNIQTNHEFLVQQINPKSLIPKFSGTEKNDLFKILDMQLDYHDVYKYRIRRIEDFRYTLIE